MYKYFLKKSNIKKISKILKLHDKLDKLGDFKSKSNDEVEDIKRRINMLNMSKECIKYYYKIDISL